MTLVLVLLRLLRLEGLPAAARADRLRIADGEAGGLNGLHPVHLDPLEHRRALRIHEHLHAAELAHPVAGLRGLGERHAIRVPGTAALLDAQPEAQNRLGLLAQQLAQFTTRGLGQRHHAPAPSFGPNGVKKPSCLDVSAGRAMPATAHASAGRCSTTPPTPSRAASSAGTTKRASASVGALGPSRSASEVMRMS